MKYLSSLDMSPIRLHQNDPPWDFDQEFGQFNIYNDNIRLLAGGPMSGTYILKSKDGDVELVVTICSQCGNAEFDIQLDTVDKNIDLINLFNDGKVVR